MAKTLPVRISRRALIGAAFIAGSTHMAKAQTGSGPAGERRTDMRVRMTFADRVMTATLYDNPAARDFHSMLPLDLRIADFANNEKIAHLPRKLTEEGSGRSATSSPTTFATMSPGAIWRCSTTPTNIPA